MNFLAHAWLVEGLGAPAWRSGLLVGGVLGDWVKGPLAAHSALSPSVRLGVQMHRQIDRFAEDHPVFQRSRQRVRPAWRRWSGILIDMYYDAALAAAWPAYHAQPLAAFTASVYGVLEAHTPMFRNVPDAAGAVALMQSEDWLSSYARDDGLHAILCRMGRRAQARSGRDNPLAEASAEYFAQREAFAEDAMAFLHAARTMCADWLAAVDAATVADL